MSGHLFRMTAGMTHEAWTILQHLCMSIFMLCSMLIDAEFSVDFFVTNISTVQAAIVWCIREAWRSRGDPGDPGHKQSPLS